MKEKKLLAKEKKLLTTKEVAELLHVHPNTIIEFVKRGQLGCIKVGKRFLFPVEEIEAYLKRQSQNLHVDIDIDELLKPYTKQNPHG